MFIIQDWTGKVCFHGKEFEGFEEAWGYIYDQYRHLPENEFNEQMGEYYVIEKE